MSFSRPDAMPWCPLASVAIGGETVSRGPEIGRARARGEADLIFKVSPIRVREQREFKPRKERRRPMDPIIPRLEQETMRRRRRLYVSAKPHPCAMLVPNFFTLLGLCAGLTSMRMSIEGRWDLALAGIAFAAFLDGIDGRVARLLKASSQFGAELDSLADFVNFGVAPAILLLTWGHPSGAGEIEKHRLDLSYDFRAGLRAAACPLQRHGR